MRIFVELDGKYLLLNQENDYTNLKEDDYKTELINAAMDKLENIKLKMEIARQSKNTYMVKKLGTHPGVGKRVFW